MPLIITMPPWLLVGNLYPLATTTYPLDLVSGATGAWSTRLLTTAYTGACLRVRRSSDDAEQDIGFIGQTIDYAALLDFVGSGDGFVRTWYSQDGGTTRDLVQTTGTNQPQIVSSGALYTTIGGYPGLHFTTSRYLNSDVIPESVYLGINAGTIFALWDADTATSTADGNTIWCNRGGWNGTFIQTISGTPNIRVFGYDGTEDFITTSGYATDTPYVTAWRHASGTLYSYVDATTEVGSVSHGTELTLTASFCVGQDSQTSNGSSGFDGIITEVITYSAALSSGDLGTVGDAMASPFGKTWGS